MARLCGIGRSSAAGEPYNLRHGVADLVVMIRASTSVEMDLLSYDSMLKDSCGNELTWCRTIEQPDDV